MTPSSYSLSLRSSTLSDLTFLLYTADGSDYSPSPENFQFNPGNTQSCLGIVVRADLFYEQTESLTGHLVALVDENGATVDSIARVVLDPVETELQIEDVDSEYIIYLYL